MEKKLEMVMKVFGLANAKTSVGCTITTEPVDNAYYELAEVTQALAYLEQEGVRYIQTDYNGFEIEFEEIKNLIKDEDESSVQCWIRADGTVEFLVLTNEKMQAAFEQVEETVSIFQQQG